MATIDKEACKRVPAEYVTAALGLRRGPGGRYWCPACNGDDSKTPDLSTKQGADGCDFFTCWKSGATGDMVKLVEHVTGETFPGALGWFGAQILSRIPQDRRSPAVATTPAAKVPNASERILARNSAMSDEAVDVIAEFLSMGETMVHCVDGETTFGNGRGAEYLAGRGIDAEVAYKVGVRYFPDKKALSRLQGSKGWEESGLSSFLSTRFPAPFLALPYFDDDSRPVFVKGRLLLTKEECEARGVNRVTNSKGQVPGLYNGGTLAGAETVWICEGETDVLAALTQFRRDAVEEAESKGCSLADVRQRRAVGVAGATAWRPEYARLFAGIPKVWTACDGDDGGRRLEDAVRKSFSAAGLPIPKRLPIPDGSDLAEYLLGG